ncbi:M13 family metallopeptidase [Granulicella cerasi]|uniref:M13 family metallopeptidase n=1 Tax=Granulicella cerasi TaxID=741063 RepID=A0ABW1ZEE3_9BACT|nr:M13 family metallopeptidase [Granulicella cerasi]
MRLKFSVLASTAALLLSPLALQAQAPSTAAPTEIPKPSPLFDAAAMDRTADPCTDFYKFSCGNFAKLHPIPNDQASVDQFYLLFNVNTARLNAILSDLSKPGTRRTAMEQKVGDDYAACMDTTRIEQLDLKPIEPLLGEIDRVSLSGLTYLAGELQRIGVNAFFSFGELQDFKDSTKQIAFIDQGGLGLPERDYYTRTGDADKKLRDQYVEHITKMLSFIGYPPQRALFEAKNILAFETKLAEAQMTVTERRDPMKIYHPETLAQFNELVRVPFAPFFEAIHAPKFDTLNNANPDYFPKLVAAIHSTPIDTLRAYLRYQLVTTYAHDLPQRIDAENFRFYGTVLNGQPVQRARWKRCSNMVDGSLGEALGEAYVDRYFAGDSKAKVLAMVHDIETSMDRDINTLDWMSPETKVKAKAKLNLITNKIGYPDKWRDYSKLEISPSDAFGNDRRAKAFENDRVLDKIGQPVDRGEWSMTPPTVNAYYDPSMNNINFPAGILQPAFYDASSNDLAANYGHMGAVIGHELTHGFDDQGAQFDGQGNLKDWWSADDKKKFEERTGCLATEYGGFTAVDDVKVNGKLTLGENTADNGGATLAFMAYLDAAKAAGVDVNAKVDGFNGPQRYWIAFAQNWCENSRPETIRQQVQTDPHSPSHFRANGVVVNQQEFRKAFGCKAGTPMAPADACRVW